ncbi:MAG TPA: apolipoprotein N-acyltransferase [Methylibium sp.]|nr:apolipoprotein N-acyltransferase [Methylibium sp.]
MRPAGWPLPAELALVAAAGGLHALSFAPQPLAWLQALCVALLAWRAAAAGSAGRAALLGGVFGTAGLAGGVWWLFISMHRYGGLPAWLAALAVALLAALLSLYLAAALAAWWRWRRGRPVGDAALFAALWLLAELARGLLLTGFPWVAAGYAHGDGALVALAPWVGVYGIGAVAAGVAALAAGAVAAQGVARWGALALATLLWWGPQALPRDFTAPGGTLSVALLQTNVAQDEKFVPEHLPATLDWVGRALLQSRADLVVAPETAIPLLPEQLPPGYWDALRGAYGEGDRAALVGLPLGSFAAGYTNSVAGLSADAARQPGGFYRYDKHHLVPFGEFIPLGFRWFVDLMRMPLGDFDRGPLDAPSFAVRGERVAPNICYEDLFGEELAVRFRDAASAPTLLANVSNIAWFGDTVAIDQHLQISRLRTLELQRPMLRATNTGATVVIDHRGVVTHALAPHTRGVLAGRVQGRVGLTPYAWWAGRFGLGPLALAALMVVAAGACWRRSVPR